jgi:hypothetical protein
MHRLMDTRRMTSEESTTPDLVELQNRLIDAGSRRDLDAITASWMPRTPVGESA